MGGAKFQGGGPVFDIGFVGLPGGK